MSSTLHAKNGNAHGPRVGCVPGAGSCASQLGSAILMCELINLSPKVRVEPGLPAREKLGRSELNLRDIRPCPLEPPINRPNCFSLPVRAPNSGCAYWRSCRQRPAPRPSAAGARSARRRFEGRLERRRATRAQEMRALAHAPNNGFGAQLDAFPRIHRQGGLASANQCAPAGEKRQIQALLERGLEPSHSAGALAPACHLGPR